jgi:1,4-alpha-glucan branching enzyme
MTFDQASVAKLMQGDHHDPFSVLGMHRHEGELVVRALLPGAAAVDLIEAKSGRRLASLQRNRWQRSVFRRHPAAQESVCLPLRVDWGTHRQDMEDPYRFPPILGEMDVWLLSEGTHYRPYEKLGAHPTVIDGVEGVAFAVWAPNARRVSVVGNFNSWDGRRHAMRARGASGVWEIFIPQLLAGDLYKFEIRTQGGELLLKADPFAFRAELRPDTASVVNALPALVSVILDGAPAGQRLYAPISIYEVHLGSWRRVPEDGNRWLTYRELAAQLIPVCERPRLHPHRADAGQRTSLRRLLGLPAGGPVCADLALRHAGGFPHFVETAHASGIGVLLDWVPGTFSVRSARPGPFRRQPACTSMPIRAKVFTRTGTP